jgi:hypothetical protein
LSGPQLLAVVCDLIQPLVVNDVVITGPTTEGVRTLGRFVVGKRIIPSPSEVLFGHKVSPNIIVSGAAVVFVLARPVVGLAVINLVVAGAAVYRIGTEAAS